MAARKSKTALAEQVAYNNVLLEQIRSDQKAMYEAMIAMNEGLRRELRSEIGKVTARLEVLESVVKQNSEDIRTLRTEVGQLRSEVAELRADVASLRTEVERLRNDFEKRDEVARIAALEARVTELERRLKVG
jgi:predicted RNase H-like nuclease (RuvC/YqgF family)